MRSYFYDNLSRPASTVESPGFHSFAVYRNYDGHLGEVQNAATTQLYWRAQVVNAHGQIAREVQGNCVSTDHKC